VNTVTAQLACRQVSFDSRDPYFNEDMIEKIEIRDSLPNDITSVEKLYRDAFPDEDLLPLVRELQREGPSVVSLVGIADTRLVAHVVFTICNPVGSTNTVALLGPLAVAPTRQRQGIGSAIVRVGLRRLKDTETNQVYVLGAPAYYRRFGFEPDDRVTPPYNLPEEWRGAWQSLNLCSDKPSLSGKLSVPHPWRKRALWAP
jgi:putative acetyltransferase